MEIRLKRLKLNLSKVILQRRVRGTHMIREEPVWLVGCDCYKKNNNELGTILNLH